jgi:hypothetical protein
VAGQLWSFVLTYPPMSKATFAPVLGAIAKARGSYQTFTIIPPNLKNPLGTQTADTVIATNTAIGSTSIPISGATVSATFVAGDIIKFSNHNKVYMLTDNTAADGGGLAFVSITPPLITAITTSHTAKHTNVPFTVALSGELQEFKTTVDGFIRYELDVEEVF